MKTMIVAGMMLMSAPAFAEHMDVIQVKLKDGCSLTQYLSIVSDFNNNFGKSHAYGARIAVPLQGENLDSFFWLGTTANAAAFGKAWDAWRDGLADSNSVSAKLAARFDSCATNVNRWGYDVY